MSCTRATVLLYLLLAALECISQVQPVPIQVEASGENNAVQLLSLDDVSEAVWAKFFRTPADREFRPYSLLLKNNSSKTITGLSLVWTITTPEAIHRHECHFETAVLNGMSGTMLMPAPMTQEELAARRAERAKARMNGEAPGPRVQVSRTDSSYPSSLAPGESAMVAPDRITFPNALSGGSPMETLNGATNISVVVDAVVLSDGLVLGPDQTGTLDALNARNAAFEALLDSVRMARERGEDPIPLLEQMAEASHRSHDRAARLQGMMANMLLHSQNWEKQFKFMETTQLVSYHR